ncbi:cyclase family protein [Candidatus Poribacteria bacterium]|nr:cyclase family protein [Candidatus Poribacteria bacterium]
MESVKQKIFIDLSVPIKNSKKESITISPINHKKGALLLGLGTIFIESNNNFDLIKNFFLFLAGKKKITSSDFPDEMGLAWEDFKSDTHSGTHLDAPWHFGPITEGKPSKTIDEIPLEWCYQDGVVLDMRNKEAGSYILIDDIKQQLKKINYSLKPLDIVLIMTGNDKYYNEKKYLLEQTGMSEEATLWLLDQGIKIIGIDAFGFDRPWTTMRNDYKASGDNKHLWPAHLAGRKKEYCHIEKLTNLDKIPCSHGFKIICFPIKIEKASAGWIRPVAIIES